MEKIRKHGLSCKAIHFLHCSQSLKLIWLHFVVCSSHTRSNSPVNWLCIKFAIRWFVQMVSTHAWFLVQPHPSPRLLCTYGLFPTPPTRSGNLGRKVILTSFLVCLTVLHQRNELLKSNNKFQINNHGQNHKIHYYIMLSIHNKNHCITLDRVQYSYLFNFEPKHFKHCYVGYLSRGGVTMLKTFFPQISPF